MTTLTAVIVLFNIFVLLVAQPSLQYGFPQQGQALPNPVFNFCAVPRIRNGYVNIVPHFQPPSPAASPDRVAPGTTIAVFCAEGYGLLTKTRNRQLTCRGNNVWSNRFDHRCAYKAGKNRLQPSWIGERSSPSNSEREFYEAWLAAKAEESLKKSCEVPDVSNGQFFYVGGKQNDLLVVGAVEVGATVRLICAARYQATGGDVISTCSPGGQWTRQFACCKSAGCGPVPIIQNGFIGSGSYFLGAVREVICSEGYSLVGPTLVQCDIKNGQWSKAGYCQKEKIDRCLDVPTIENGVVLEGDSAVGSARAFQCNESYTATGEQIIKCNRRGKWQTVLGSRCVPTDRIGEDRSSQTFNLFQAFRQNVTADEIKKILSSGQVDVNSHLYSKSGRSPLHFAAIIGDAEIAAVLINAGANLTARDFNSFLPIHLAVIRCNVDIVRFFAEKFPKLIEFKDKFGRKPSDLADLCRDKNTSQQMFDFLSAKEKGRPNECTEVPKAKTALGLWMFNSANHLLDVTFQNDPLESSNAVRSSSSIGPFGVANSSFTVTSNENSAIGSLKGLEAAKSFTIAFYFRSGTNESVDVIQISDTVISQLTLRYVKPSTLEIRGSGEKLTSKLSWAFRKGEWTFIAVVYDAFDKSLATYSNKSLVTFDAFANNVQGWAPNSQLVIGRGMQPGDEIACLAIYKEALTEGYIRAVQRFCNVCANKTFEVNDAFDRSAAKIGKKKKNNGAAAMLLHASESGSTSAVEDLLLNLDVNPNVPERLTGETPLHKAAKHGHLKIVQALTAAGANFNLRTKEGYLPIHLAAFNCKDEIVQFFLKIAPNLVNAADTYGRSVVNLAKLCIEEEAKQRMLRSLQKPAA